MDSFQFRSEARITSRSSEGVKIWKLVSKLKNEPRRGWISVEGVDRIESVADHSFGVAMLSLFEAELRAYDVEKTMKLALIHDLEEAITGDLTPRDKRTLSRTRLLQLRNSAKSRVIGVLPAELRQEYTRLWNELTSGETKEARLVKDLDKFEMLLQAKHYESSRVTSGKLDRFYKSALDGIKDRTLKKRARGLTKNREVRLR